MEAGHYHPLPDPHLCALNPTLSHTKTIQRPVALEPSSG